MIVSINQPAYLPWLGYFDRIAKSDLHIVLDDVQIERNTSTSFTNRNKIKNQQGWSWLTIPIKRGQSDEANIIKNIKIGDNSWRRKHLNSLSQSYSKATYFGEYKTWLEELYGSDWLHLNSLLKSSTEFLLDALTIKTPLLHSSELNVVGKKSELILNYCKQVGATTYLSGPFGREYLAADSFSQSGIDIQFHDYKHPEYDQLHGQFIPFMSVVDLLFNHGANSKSILVTGRSK